MSSFRVLRFDCGHFNTLLLEVAQHQQMLYPCATQDAWSAGIFAWQARDLVF